MAHFDDVGKHEKFWKFQILCEREKSIKFSFIEPKMTRVQLKIIHKELKKYNTKYAIKSKAEPRERAEWMLNVFKL